ncbi:MAG: 50S ribosomal protein L21e [archaeon]
MAKRVGGFRRKTRSKLKKPVRARGKIVIKNFFREFKSGDKVLLKAEPAVQKAMYFPRYHAKTGTVQGKRGRCYEVSIMDGGKRKMLVIHPVHLRKV